MSPGPRPRHPDPRLRSDLPAGLAPPEPGTPFAPGKETGASNEY